MRRMLDPVRRQIRLMLSRAVGRMVDPTTLLQQLQVELLRGEVLDGIEHLEGYGRTAHPPDGYEALVASLGGDRAHTVALAVFHRQYRPKNLLAGEQAIYDDQGQVIALLRDKTIHIYGCDHLVADVAIDAVITCPEVTINGNLTVFGTIAATGQITSDTGVSTGDIELGTHRHGNVANGAGISAGPQV